MGFNYAHEKARFDREWKKTQQTYRAAGINEEAIQEMHDFDWSLFKKERIYQLHTQKLEGTDFGGEDSAQTDKSPLLKRFFAELSFCDDYTAVSRYGWIDDLSDTELARRVSMLSQADLELLTLLVIDELPQKQIAVMRSCSQQNISKRIQKIKKILQGRL